MSTEDLDLSELESGLFSLFKHVFMSNCHLDGASITEEEQKTLEELDSLEVLENFKDVALQLLKFKQDHIDSDTAELTEKCEKFESMLQKLESEVRNHISVEHQLRLHVENTQTKLEQAEAEATKAAARVKELEQRLDASAVLKSKNFEKKLSEEIQRVTKDRQSKSNSDHGHARLRQEYEAKLQEMLERKNQRLKVVEEEKARLRKELLGKAKEVEAMRASQTKNPRVNKRSARPTANLENLRKHLVDKSHELSKLQARHTLLHSPSRPVKGHVKRGSMAHERASPNGEGPKRPKSSSRQHVRSQSEYCGPNKRAPSR